MKIIFEENGKVVREEGSTPETYNSKNEFGYKNWVFKAEVII